MIGLIVCAPALAVARKDHREADRIAFLYTRDYGKVPVRFPGASRARGKLKALSEPLVAGEYRLHMRRGAEFATAVGGSLSTSFPGLRRDLDATLRGLEVCELLDALTPAWQPNPEKYALALGCLEALEAAALAGSEPGWAPFAFSLRLLESAGFGLSGLRTRAESRGLWSTLHELDFASLAALPPDPERMFRLEAFLDRTLERILDRPLRCARLRRSLAAPPVLK